MLVIDCCYEEKRSPKVFWFEAFWTDHLDFKDVVRRGWRLVENGRETKFEELARWLKLCSIALRKWSKIAFPNNIKVIDSLRDQIALCYEGTLIEEVNRRIDTLITEIEAA
ncbi:hypothetical protein K1719_017739 [Acacia pycnantha]|nr:hypothetical protein K1719_017739 [Acacia pycnantha]